MTRPQLTRDEARHVLEEIAGLVIADRAQAGRIWTRRVILAVVPTLCHWVAAEEPDLCAEWFDEFCRERAVMGSGTASDEDIAAAEATADRILGLLLGESECAPVYRFVGDHGPAA